MAEHYHFVGVGGVGMSAVAQAVLGPGISVSGSDRDRDAGKSLAVLDKLSAAGISLVPQDGSGITADTTAVVVSTAIEDDNPDLVKAGQMGVIIQHRAEMLAALVKDKQCVAITGTSGKSTVTGMVGWILSELGRDPFVVNGAGIANWCDADHIGNVRRGQSDLWVIEADESDRSLLSFSPDWAVVTNVSADHFDLEESVALFESFVGQVKQAVIDVPACPELLRGFQAETGRDGSFFEYGGVRFELSLPGRHNAENAFLAVRLCELMGCDLQETAGALAGFKGICRRLEKVGSVNDITVIDDYGHNPAKIKAAWQALSPYHERVFAVWRPHGFWPLRSMMGALVEMFDEVRGRDDRLYLLPVYDAGGTADRSVGSDFLVEKLVDAGVKAVLAQTYEDVVAEIKAEAKPGDVVLSMGARDPDLPKLGREILAALRD